MRCATRFTSGFCDRDRASLLEAISNLSPLAAIAVKFSIFVVSMGGIAGDISALFSSIEQAVRANPRIAKARNLCVRMIHPLLFSRKSEDRAGKVLRFLINPHIKKA